MASLYCATLSLRVLNESIRPGMLQKRVCFYVVVAVLRILVFIVDAALLLVSSLAGSYFADPRRSARARLGTLRLRNKCTHGTHIFSFITDSVFKQVSALESHGHVTTRRLYYPSESPRPT